MTLLRLAVLAESPTDDAVAGAVVAHLRRTAVDLVPVPAIRTRGWPALLAQLPQVVRAVYYHSDADALVVLADNDSAPLHDPRTHTAAGHVSDCRWCSITAALERTQATLRPVPSRRLLTAVGCAVPALEAWLLAGQPAPPTEAGWLLRGSGGQAGAVAHKEELKRRAFGAVTVTTNRAAVAADLIQEALAIPGLLRTAFPGGYGPLEDAISNW